MRGLARASLFSSFCLRDVGQRLDADRPVSYCDHNSGYVVNAMNDEIVSLREAKAQLSELAERASNGIDVVIAKHGRPAARLTAARAARKRVDLAALRELTDSQPRQSENAGRAMRRLRDAARY